MHWSIIFFMQNMISCFSYRGNVTWTCSSHDLLCTEGGWICLPFKAQNMKTHFRGPFHARCVLLPVLWSQVLAFILLTSHTARVLCQMLKLNPLTQHCSALSTGLFAEVCLYRRPIQPRLMALNARGLLIDRPRWWWYTPASDGPTGSRGFDRAAV